MGLFALAVPRGHRARGTSNAKRRTREQGGEVRYIYLGDRHTRPELRGVACDPVRRDDGRCIVGKRLASAMVVLDDGTRHVVARRRLRLASKEEK